VQVDEWLNPYEYLEHNASADPHGVFLESATTSFSNVEAADYVQKIVFELRRAGLIAGEVVALDLPSELALLFTEALFHEGVVSCVLPRRFGQRSDFAVDWLISSDPAKSATGRNFLFVDDVFIRQLESNPVGIRTRAQPAPTDIARLVFSSGTTGRPKAVALTWEMVEFRSKTAREVWMRGTPFMSLLDASTASGFFTFYASVMEGLRYLASGNAERNVELLRRNFVRAIKASPVQIAELVGVLEAQDIRLPELRSALIAGSVLPPELTDRLRARTSAEIFNLYGSTEVGTASARYVDSDDPFDAGLPTSGSTIEVVDERDCPLPPRQSGMVRYKRPLMTTGYLGDDDASKASFRDGWFYPGDFGVLREDGGLTLLGRQSEFINAGGVKLDPVQLDLFAISMDGVLDACTFGYRDESGLQQVGLAVITAPDADGAALADALKDAFGPASPRLLARVDEIPRNEMGKPLRLELAERFAPKLRLTS
jgi:long-chain acyl-CoA synthetase